MRVYLVRHGDADAEVPEGLDDEARPLTTRARLGLVPHFAALRASIGTPSAIFMSPLVRAVQTATLFAYAIGHEGPLRTHRSLFPDSPVGAIESLLAGQSGPVVLVGHQPSMGATAAHLLGMASLPKAVTPGTVIGIEDGKLVLYAQPGQPPVTSFDVAATGTLEATP